MSFFLFVSFSRSFFFLSVQVTKHVLIVQADKFHNLKRFFPDFFLKGSVYLSQDVLRLKCTQPETRTHKHFSVVLGRVKNVKISLNCLNCKRHVMVFYIKYFSFCYFNCTINNCFQWKNNYLINQNIFTVKRIQFSFFFFCLETKMEKYTRKKRENNFRTRDGKQRKTKYRFPSFLEFSLR